MTDNDYIRAGVELAEGWYFEVHHNKVSDAIRSPSGYRSFVGDTDEILDALAAQLARQYMQQRNEILSYQSDPMDTIRYVVDRNKQ